MSSEGQNCPFGNRWPGVCMTALPPAASSELYHLSLFTCNLGINSQEFAVFAEGWTAQISSPKFLTCCSSGSCSGGGTNDLTPWQFRWACYLCRGSSPWAATPLVQELQTNSREAAFLIMWPRSVMYKMTLRWPGRVTTSSRVPVQVPGEKMTHIIRSILDHSRQNSSEIKHWVCVEFKRISSHGGCGHCTSSRWVSRN